MKKVLSVIMVIVMYAMLFPVSVCADEEKESYDFGSYFDFEEWMYKEGREYTSFAEWLGDISGVYVPVAYDVNNITRVAFTRHEIICSIRSDNRDLYADFIQYFDEEHYNSQIAAQYGRGSELTYRNTDLLIFNNYDPDSFENEGGFEYSRIFWKENGHFFSVETDHDPSDTAVLELTHYRKVSFNKGIVMRNGKITYLDKKGRRPKKGWKTVNGRKYYFKADGTVISRAENRSSTAKTVIGGVMYEFDYYGVCKGRYTGWYKAKKGKRYYSDGKYLTGTQEIDGKTYTFDQNGYLKENTR